MKTVCRQSLIAAAIERIETSGDLPIAMAVGPLILLLLQPPANPTAAVRRDHAGLMGV
jgi:hypothetical protein